jgi:site-specific DNA recombinase
MRLRCTAYARYSSDRQSPASIHDQIRKCREFAEQKGWEFPEDQVFTDEAVSGAGSDRPGLMRLLEAASRTPCPFDVVLLDDTSRLSRNLGDVMKIVEMLSFKGIRVVSVSQGIDSEDEQADVLMTVHGLVDSLYLKELAKKTHRGLEGRAIQGFHTGGRCFGYDNVSEDGSVRLRINEAEAGVVRRVFNMAADGMSLKKVAKALNAEHIPSPRPRSGKVYATWCPTAIREMLRRELYVGRIVWNRSRFVKQPGTNKRLRRERPQSEWRITERPELRIIEDPLWNRVQTHLAFVARTFGKGKPPGLYHRAASSPYLLSGLLKCGSCGANLVIVTGRGKGGHPRFGCPQNFHRGACTNGLKERADWIEDRLLSQLQDAILRPEYVDFAIEQFERQLQTSLSALDSRMGRMRQRAAQLQQEIGNLAATAAQCGPTPALVNEINTRQQELDGITRQLLTTEPDSISAEIARIRQFITARIGNIRGILHADVQRAKVELAKHVTAIEMVPEADGKKGHYVAAGEWNLLGGYGEAADSDGGKCVRVVAGGGFEPPTFGL